MSREIETLRRVVIEYDLLVAEKDRYHKLILKIAEAMGFNGSAIPSRYMSLPFKDGIAEAIIAVIEDAKVNAFRVAAEANERDEAAKKAAAIREADENGP